MHRRLLADITTKESSERADGLHWASVYLAALGRSLAGPCRKLPTHQLFQQSPREAVERPRLGHPPELRPRLPAGVVATRIRRLHRLLLLAACPRVALGSRRQRLLPSSCPSLWLPRRQCHSWLTSLEPGVWAQPPTWRFHPRLPAPACPPGRLWALHGDASRPGGVSGKLLSAA